MHPLMLLKLTHPVISTGILGTKSRIADIQISSKQIKIHRTAVRLPCPDSGSASLPAATLPATHWHR